MSNSISSIDTAWVCVSAKKQTIGRSDLEPIDASQLLEVGYLGKPHGLRGEIRLTRHNPTGDTLDCVERLVVRVQANYEVLAIESIRGGENPALVAFDGFESRNDVERLRGATVFAFRSELPPLEPGEYYLSDLVGATVVGPDGEVGRVVDLVLYPTVDSLVIEDGSGKRVEQPLAEPWLESVDAAARVVRLRSLDGLID